ncbi:hypothetical protein [Nitrospina watsonii]|uniref:Secreted protein n=1 Tax=Nitrospina watsonii TaxID=1323948 RepID=A0ABM9HAP8_9BACT|nr:hypothetical protein [Nitrospina watsonii]CAI2717205.1 exported protein of unknown function [Nitrospina watsonii]
MKRMIGMLLLCLLATGPVSAAASSIKCDPPYEPSNIVEVLFFYPGTMKYLAHGPDACRAQFRDALKPVVKDTWLLSEGCIEATLKDIDNSYAGNLKPQWQDAATIPPEKPSWEQAGQTPAPGRRLSVYAAEKRLPEPMRFLEGTTTSLCPASVVST